MSTPLEDMSYTELVTYVTAQLHDGLITGGGKEMKSRVHLWLGQAIQWNKAQEAKKNEGKGTIKKPGRGRESAVSG